MKKFLGSIANILSLLGIFFGLYSLATAYLFYTSSFIPCEGICTAEFKDWHQPLYYGIAYLAGGIVLHFIGKWLKK